MGTPFLPLMRRTLFVLAAAGLVTATQQVQADAEVVYLNGNVRSDRGPVAQGQRVSPGTTVTTGPGAQADLHFSDRQRVLLGENTTFRIAAFNYVPREPQADRASFELLRGSVRLVSGAVGSRNPGVVALQIPQATLSPRGTDFMVALVDPAYLKVLQGAVAVTNGGGTVVFGENSAARVASGSAVAQPVFVAALPRAASNLFSSLAAAPMRAPAAQAAASSTASAAGSAVSPPAAGIAKAPATQAAASGASGAVAPASSAASPSAASIGKSALWGVWAALLVGALASDSVSSHSTTSHP